jgi:succinoglycan biosynthesis transport protein ExoP
MKMFQNPAREASLVGDLRSIAGILWAKAGIITLCVVCAATIGFFYARMTPKTYSAKTVIQVEQGEQTVMKIDGVKTEDLKAPEVFKTYEQNILSSDVLLRVIKNGDLMNNPAFLPEVKGVRSDNALQTALAKRITAKIRRDSRLIDITVEDRIPALAQRIADLLVKEFILWNSQARSEAAQTANRFLHERADEVGRQLAKSENDLQAYKESHGEVSLNEKQRTGAGTLNQLDLRIAEVKAERLKLQSDAAQLVRKSRYPAAELLTFPSIASAPAIVDLLKKIGDKEATIAPLMRRYKEGHPTLIGAQSELDELRAALESAVFKTAKLLDVRLRELRLMEQNLTEALREQQKLTLGEDAVAIGYATLTREVDSNRALYESVVKRTKETDITKDLDQEVVRVVARPLLPDLPVGPKPALILALSIMAGLGVGCLLAFAMHATDRSLRTLQDAETRLGLPSLGEIPRLAQGKRKALNPPGRVESDLAMVESFRTLRTSLSLLEGASDRKNILFTSARAGEGKTFCAINCAISFAQMGLKTLLIDADFRLPSVEQILLGTREAPGMSDLLLGEMPMDEAIHLTGIENLAVLPAGQRVTEPVELLSGSRLTAILDQAANDFDRIVIDTAPVHLVSETLLLVKHADYVCLVIRAGETPAEDVLRTSHRLAEAGARLVGFVWNQVKPRSGYHQYYERAAEKKALRKRSLLTRDDSSFREEFSVARNGRTQNGHAEG